MSEHVTVWVDGLPDMVPGEEVVRCRDCENWAGPCCEEHELGVCNVWISSSGPMQIVTEPDGFCSWGERLVDK